MKYVTKLSATKYVITIIILLMVSTFSEPAFAQGPPVLAFYYAWFDEHTWTSGQPADIPNSSYRSADPAAIERHVAQAKSAGINAFVQSWYGPQAENNQTETNFRMLLDTAAAQQFQAAVDVEVMGPFFPDRGSVQAGLASLMTSHIHHPAYLRFQGKPVIFFWRQQRFSVAEWAEIRAAVDPNRTTYWIAEGTDLSYQDVFDGHHLYSIAWAGDVRTELNKWPPRLQQIEAQTGVDKLWVATAMPGYNDLNLARSNAFARSREQGAYFRQTWAAAQATQPDIIIINSFNEWLEGTQIEPSVTYGDFYLNLTRELVSGAGNVPAVVETPPEPAEQQAPPTPVETDAAPPEPTPGLPEGLTYTVQPGDTLSNLAVRYDIPIEAIMAANGLSNPDQLSLGQQLLLQGLDPDSEIILPEPPVSIEETDENTSQDHNSVIQHTIQQGDTLYGLAFAYDVTLEALIQANNISETAVLSIGQILVIPTDEAPPAELEAEPASDLETTTDEGLSAAEDADSPAADWPIASESIRY